MSHEIRAAVELEDGQTMVEYAAILGVITLAIVVSMTTLAGVVQGLITRVVGFFS